MIALRRDANPFSAPRHLPTSSFLPLAQLMAQNPRKPSLPAVPLVAHGLCNFFPCNSRPFQPAPTSSPPSPLVFLEHGPKVQATNQVLGGSKNRSRTNIPRFRTDQGPPSSLQPRHGRPRSEPDTSRPWELSAGSHRRRAVHQQAIRCPISGHQAPYPQPQQSCHRRGNNNAAAANVDKPPEKKRKFTDELDLRAAAVANRKRLAKKFDQIDTTRNHDVNDKCFPLREFPTDELEHRLHTNLPHFPSYLYTIDDQHPDVNFYSVQNPQTGRIIGKVDITDKEAMMAMVDTLMGLGKKHGARVGTFTFDIRSIDADRSTEIYKIIQARNAPLSMAQDTEPAPLGQQPKQHRQLQQHRQPQQSNQHQLHQNREQQQRQQQPQRHEQQQPTQQNHRHHQLQKPPKPHQHEEPQVPQVPQQGKQEKQHQQHPHQPQQKPAEQPADQDDICGHCGAKGHMLQLCCVPMSPTESCKGGSIAGCPFCNTMAHSIDACSALDKYLDGLPKPERYNFLAKLLCFNRYNRPAIRSEK